MRRMRNEMLALVLTRNRPTRRTSSKHVNDSFAISSFLNTTGDRLLSNRRQNIVATSHKQIQEFGATRVFLLVVVCTIVNHIIFALGLGQFLADRTGIGFRVGGYKGTSIHCGLLFLQEACIIVLKFSSAGIKPPAIDANMSRLESVSKEFGGIVIRKLGWTQTGR